MKSIFGEILKNDRCSFFIGASDTYHALNDFHDHPELELIDVMEGAGSFLIHEKLGRIAGGMMVMIGSNVPHMFKFDSFSYANPLWKQGKSPDPVKLLTLHFDPQVFGAHFLSLPENYLMSRLFHGCRRGLKIHPDHHDEVREQMQTLLKSPDYDRLHLLIRLLTSIGRFRDHEFINGDTGDRATGKIDEKRLTKIYLYTLYNFRKTIKLQEVAALIYMSPNAFCRYFKTHTQKSYFEFLLGVRIDQACRLLKETDDNMVTICYECGFSNHSNFNRHFKSITGVTPLEYRKKIV